MFFLLSEMHIFGTLFSDVYQCTVSNDSVYCDCYNRENPIAFSLFIEMVCAICELLFNKRFFIDADDLIHSEFWSICLFALERSLFIWFHFSGIKIRCQVADRCQNDHRCLIWLNMTNWSDTFMMHGTR